MKIEDILENIKSGNIKLVKKAVTRTNVNNSHNGFTPLHIATLFRQTEVARFLLKRHAIITV